jgi:hypothetical protein
MMEFKGETVIIRHLICRLVTVGPFPRAKQSEASNTSDFSLSRLRSVLDTYSEQELGMKNFVPYE